MFTVVVIFIEGVCLLLFRSFGVLARTPLRQTSLEIVACCLFVTKVCCCLVNAFWGPLCAMCVHALV